MILEMVDEILKDFSPFLRVRGRWLSPQARAESEARLAESERRAAEIEAAGLPFPELTQTPAQKRRSFFAAREQRLFGRY